VVDRKRLNARPVFRFAGLVAVVIALHAWALHWLGNALEAVAFIRPMAAPMFTRVLMPETPPPVEAPTRRPKKRTTLAAVTAPAKPAAKPASSAVAPPTEVAASSPQVPTGTVAPLAAASAAASAPAAAASSASLDTWPVDTRLSYGLTGWYRGTLTGSARVQWLRQSDRYEARVDLDLGILGMQFLSQGDVTGDSLAPRAYQESRPNRTRIVQLGPENVVLNDGRTVDKPAGVQDTASQFVELSHRFSTGKEKLVVGGQTSVWLARPGGVDLWTYDIISRDMLSTPQLGAVEAFHLKPRPIHDARGDIYVEIWLAPTLQYLPVRIRITQPPDSYVDILVDKIEQH
jgi:hypothetical protein